MIEALISSKTRIKLLLKFFLNSNNTGYLRSLESEFGESSNAIRVELNRFEEAGMLSSFNKGNRKYFQANTKHPLYNEMNSIIRKQFGIDKIIENIIESLGNVERVYVAGALAKGLDSKIIDLIFVGDINKEYLIKLIEKVENLIFRKIRYVVYESGKATYNEFSYFIYNK
jgi:predicted nucleotidyltransferase